jgi:hypothetical protein
MSSFFELRASSSSTKASCSQCKFNKV